MSDRAGEIEGESMTDTIESLYRRAMALPPRSVARARLEARAWAIRHREVLT